jgi:hypothetical protein
MTRGPVGCDIRRHASSSRQCLIAYGVFLLNEKRCGRIIETPALYRIRVTWRAVVGGNRGRLWLEEIAGPALIGDLHGVV